MKARDLFVFAGLHPANHGGGRLVRLLEISAAIHALLKEEDVEDPASLLVTRAIHACAEARIPAGNVDAVLDTWGSEMVRSRAEALDLAFRAHARLAYHLPLALRGVAGERVRSEEASLDLFRAVVSLVDAFGLTREGYLDWVSRNR